LFSPIDFQFWDTLLTGWHRQIPGLWGVSKAQLGWNFDDMSRRFLWGFQQNVAINTPIGATNMQLQHATHKIGIPIKVDVWMMYG